MTTVLIGQLSFLFVLPKNIKSIITSLSDYYTASVVHSISSLDLSSPIPTLILALARLIEKSSRYISIENMSRCLEIKRSIQLIQKFSSMSSRCRNFVFTVTIRNPRPSFSSMFKFHSEEMNKSQTKGDGLSYGIRKERYTAHAIQQL